MTLEIDGIITDKQPYSGDKESAPAGYIYIGNDKFTCWEKEVFDKHVQGESIHINYTEKENEFNGRKFINRNISSVSKKESDLDIEEIKISDSQPENQSDIAFISEPFKINNLTYKIVGKLELQ